MRTQINKEELKREWIITNWAEKLVYIIGYAFAVYLALCFTVGLVIGIVNL